MNKSAQKKSSQKKGFKKQILLLCSCCAIGILLLLTAVNLNSYLTTREVLGLKTQNEQNDLELNEGKNYWENFVSQNPTYFEGWIELTKIYVRLADFEAAKTAFTMAKGIKPNSKDLGPLEEKLK